MNKPAILLVLILCVRVHAAAAEYTYSCWLHGWRKNANDRSADIFGIETSHFGFTLDVADFRKVGFGQLNNAAGYEQALEHKADKLRQLPPDEFRITVKGPGSRGAVPFLLDLRPPANTTGLCPILCDQSGRPTGIPVQLSKNWMSSLIIASSHGIGYASLSFGILLCPPGPSSGGSFLYSGNGGA